VEHFCPPHLIGQNKDGITGLAFSQAGEMLASYSYDNIYLFEREHGLHFNNFKVGEKLLMDETMGATLPQTFKGHQNMQTVKGVNFLGPNYDFVASGSDCGYVFIWRKKGGELIRVMKGDKRIVNCVEQHPSESIFASSGIDTSIKIWGAGGSEDPSVANFDEVCSLFLLNKLCFLLIVVFFGCRTW
jgi:WD repeat-containing protein 42A